MTDKIKEMFSLELENEKKLKLLKLVKVDETVSGLKSTRHKFAPNFPIFNPIVPKREVLKDPESS